MRALGSEKNKKWREQNWNSYVKVDQFSVFSNNNISFCISQPAHVSFYVLLRKYINDTHGCYDRKLFNNFCTDWCSQIGEHSSTNLCVKSFSIWESISNRKWFHAQIGVHRLVNIAVPICAWNHFLFENQSQIENDFTHRLVLLCYETIGSWIQGSLLSKNY